MGNQQGWDTVGSYHSSNTKELTACRSDCTKGFTACCLACRIGLPECAGIKPDGKQAGQLAAHRSWCG